MAKRGRARRRRSGRDYRQELVFAAGARHLSGRTRRGLLAWMWRRPGRARVFWALDPATGEWRMV
ncbi:MAG: hypothetical protein P8189_23225 [Anaerolineae bacterium]